MFTTFKGTVSRIYLHFLLSTERVSNVHGDGSCCYTAFFGHIFWQFYLGEPTLLILFIARRAIIIKPKFLYHISHVTYKITTKSIISCFNICSCLFLRNACPLIFIFLSYLAFVVYIELFKSTIVMIYSNLLYSIFYNLCPN